jgi:flagellin
MVIAINAETGNTGVTAAIDSATGGVKLTATDGRNIEISTLTSVAITGSQIGIALNGTASGSRTVTTIRSSVDLSSTGTTMTVASSGNGSTASGISSGGYSANGTPLVDLTSASGCQAAISLIDNAIKTVSSARASIGASESGLISIASNLDNIIMNLTESRSRILDTDYAVATTELSRSQIIAQASTAMLAQANLSAKDVLTLLKND